MANVVDSRTLVHFSTVKSLFDSIPHKKNIAQKTRKNNDVIPRKGTKIVFTYRYKHISSRSLQKSKGRYDGHVEHSKSEQARSNETIDTLQMALHKVTQKFEMAQDKLGRCETRREQNTTALVP